MKLLNKDNIMVRHGKNKKEDRPERQQSVHKPVSNKHVNIVRVPMEAPDIMFRL